MLGEKLQESFGDKAVFLDIDNIPLGVDFRTHINSAVSESDILIALIGDSWLEAKSMDGKRQIDHKTDFVRLEIESALDRNIPVIPVLVGNAQMPNESELPESLSSLPYRNAAEIRPGRDLKNHINMLVKGIESHLKLKNKSVENPPEERAETIRKSSKTTSEQATFKVDSDNRNGDSQKTTPTKQGKSGSPYFNFKAFLVLTILGALFLLTANQLRGGDVANFFGFSGFFLLGLAVLILLTLIIRFIMPKRRKK